LEFKYKLAAALIALVLVVGVLLAVNYYILSRETNITPSGNYNLDETFTAESFTYGPQGWMPYNEKLPVQPGGNIDSETYYVMFVDLNATSNPNSTFPCVRIDYAFSGLHGTAAFHVYGYVHENGGISWTNRVDGLGASGWYVVANAGTQSTITGIQPLPDFNHVYVKVANKNGATYNDYGNNTYYMKFDKAGGGLNTMHLSADPKNPSGEVTYTANATGTFYADFTGDRVQEDLILLVAVNGQIGSDFSLSLRTEPQ
jgi:hypothetical protein